MFNRHQHFKVEIASRETIRFLTLRYGREGVNDFHDSMVMMLNT